MPALQERRIKSLLSTPDNLSKIIPTEKNHIVSSFLLKNGSQIDKSIQFYTVTFQRFL